jgi:transcriptional regulator GlxA family with amidase domain
VTARAIALAFAVGLLAHPPLSDAASPPRRPVVVVVAENDGTETTDFLVPHGVLAMSEVVDLYAVSTRTGPVTMVPALTIELDQTTAGFDASHPDGADFVIVPAVHRSTDPVLIAWLRGQSARGATLVGICDGVWVVAASGALAGKQATGHWYSLDDLEDDFPQTTWVRDRRYLRDGPVMTTTGITASMPATLALIETIAGPARAREVATRLGIDEWSDAHDSRRFTLSWTDLGTAAGNYLALWRHETVGIPIAAGVDQIGLALTADALSRTYRSRALSLASSQTPLRTRQGIRIVPDAVDSNASVDLIEPLPDASTPPARALDDALSSIARRYGDPTADLVALQLEYPEHRLRNAHATP